MPKLPLVVIILTIFLSSCSGNNNIQSVSSLLNSRYNDEQPALSGDGKWLAMVSNRNGRHEILLYDIELQKFTELPNLSFSGAIFDSPSLSYTGRYLVYISSIQGRPDIFMYDRAIKRSQLITRGYRSWLRNPRISSDGRYIVFETSRRGQWDIEILDNGINMELDILNNNPIIN